MKIYKVMVIVCTWYAVSSKSSGSIPRSHVKVLENVLSKYVKSGSQESMLNYLFGDPAAQNTKNLNIYALDHKTLKNIIRAAIEKKKNENKQHPGNNSNEIKEYPGNNSKEIKEYPSNNSKEINEYSGNYSKEIKEYSGNNSKEIKEYLGDKNLRRGIMGAVKDYVFGKEGYFKNPEASVAESLLWAKNRVISRKAFQLMRQSIYTVRERLQDTNSLRKRFENDESYQIGLIIGNIKQLILKSESLYGTFTFLRDPHFLWPLVIYEKILACHTDVTELVNQVFQIHRAYKEKTDELLKMSF